MQWRMYDRAAREAGLKTRTWFDNSPVPQADVVHAFNVDRPLGIYPKLVQAKRLGIPVILSTIHHPHEWLARARRFEPPAGVLGKLLCRSPVGRSVPFTEAARELAMLVRDRRLAQLPDLIPSWRTRVRWLLSNADRIALLTQEEATYIREDFGYAVPPEQSLVLPNWVEGVGEASIESPKLFDGLPEPPVIVVGRIEPRKNSLRVCRLAEIAQRHVVFVGEPLWGETSFLETFRRAVLRSHYARWIPGVRRLEMAQIYSHSSFLLNASFVEVSPLVDIEALACGCPVATTKYALHHRLLPPNTPLCDPYDDRSIVEQLRWRPERLEPRQVIDPERCRNELIEAYADLASPRAPARRHFMK